MVQKRVNKILWHGDELENGAAKKPAVAEAADGLDGLNRGELYICDADEDPAIMIRTASGEVVRIGGGNIDAYTKEQTDTLLSAKLDASVFDDLFEKVELSDGTYAIRAKYGIYTDYFLSAKGLSTQGGGGGTGGATSLGQLVNVGSWADEVPSYDRVMVQLAGQTKWAEKKLSEIGGGLDENQLEQYLTTNNYAKKSDIPSLTGYATQSWVTSQGYAMTADLETKADKTITINAGTGLTGGGNLSTNRTISLATVGTAGTYTKVTVDAYGRVTGNSSLVAADIPTLAISKINGLQSALDSKLNASVFNDLFEKVEISTGVYAIRAKYGLYTDSFLSAKGYTEEGGSSGGSSYLSDLLDVNLTELATDDMLKWNGEKWVNIPMSSIAGVSSWDEITGKPSWIGDTKPSYTFAEITSKPTTIAGYGITDAYTKIDSDTRYVTLSTDQTITGTKTFSKSITTNSSLYATGNLCINFDTDESRVRGVLMRNTSKETIASIYYHNTAKNIILNPIGASDIYNDALGKYSLFVGNNKLTYNTYSILHTGNYSATLDTRYVKKAGDTMTGALTINYNTYPQLKINNGSGGYSIIKFQSSGTDKVSVGYSTTVGALLQNNENANNYINIKSGNLLWKNTFKFWHAGNDGSGSGLDADTIHNH